MTQEKEYYKVVKVMRKSERRQVLCRNLSKEEAQRMVKTFPDSSRSMVVFMPQLAWSNAKKKSARKNPW